jgi:hypothetical protein
MLRSVLSLKNVMLQNTQVATLCGCHKCAPAFLSPDNMQRYCRRCKQWFNEECVQAQGHQLNTNAAVKTVLPPSLRNLGISFDPQFLTFLTMPIRRGGSCGVVGNGYTIIEGKSLLKQTLQLGRLPDGWNDTVKQGMLSLGDDVVPRYYCLTCATAAI